MSRGTWDISAGGLRELDEKLSEYYGIEDIWYQGDFDDGDGGYWQDVLLYWDGQEEHFLAQDVWVHGHGPSGAVGCFEDDLPDKDEIRAKVDDIEDADNRGGV